MNAEQQAAIESAIVIIRNTAGHYSTRDILSTLTSMVENNSGSNLRSVATIQQAVGIEVEKLQATLDYHNGTMQRIGEARAKGLKHLAGALATEAVCTLGDRLTRTTSKLSRLADGRK